MAPVRLLTATEENVPEQLPSGKDARRVFPGAGSVLMDSEGGSAHHPCKHTLYIVLRQRAEQLRIRPNKHAACFSCARRRLAGTQSQKHNASEEASARDWSRDCLLAPTHFYYSFL